MKTINIVLIGAGSAHFSMTFVRDLCLSKALKGCDIHLRLVDINPDRLMAIKNLAERYAGELNVPLHVEATTDRSEALPGADFVVNTALACNYSRMMEGFEIARKHGFDYPGSYHILYDEFFLVNFFQFQLFEGIAADISRYCPQAYHLMVANPVISGVTLLGRKYPQVRTIGICHGYSALYQIAEKMGFTRDQVQSYAMSGVNHFLWLQDATVDGKPFLPLVEQWLKEHSNEVLNDDCIWRTTSAARSDFFFKHGVLPIGDTMHWTGAEWPWWYRSSPEIRTEYNEKVPDYGWQHLFEWTSQSTANFQDWAADQDIRITEKFPPRDSDELMVPLIEAIALDQPRIFVLNVMNSDEFVPGVPEDFQVEAPVLVSGRGVQPIQALPLPKHIIAHILRDRVATVEMELAAYNDHRRDFLVELVLMDKHARSLKQAEAFVDDILNIPWNSAMREHYR